MGAGPCRAKRVQKAEENIADYICDTAFPAGSYTLHWNDSVTHDGVSIYTFTDGVTI